MAEKSFGFNSAGTAPGDRAYVASDYMAWLNVHFGGNNGIVPGFLNELEVTSLGSYGIAVNTGAAVFNGYTYSNDSSLTKTLSSAATTYKRYDRLVVRFDDVGARLAVVAVIEGTASTGTPTIPSLGAKDVALATVYVDNTSGTPVFTVTDNRSYRLVPLGPSNVAATNIASSAVTEPKIGSGAVTESKIGAGAVTDSKAGTLTIDAMASGYKFVGLGVSGSISGVYTIPNIPIGCTAFFSVNPTGASSVGLPSGSGVYYGVVLSSLGTTVFTNSGGTTFVKPSSGDMYFIYARLS